MEATADQPTAKGASAYRHIACNVCRSRKVRCDGRKPFCKQCASGRNAWKCDYPASARKGRPKSSRSNNHHDLLHSEPVPLTVEAASLPISTTSSNTQGQDDPSCASSSAETAAALPVVSPFDLDLDLYNLDMESPFFDGILQYDKNMDDVFNSISHSLSMSTCSSSSVDSRSSSPDKVIMDISDDENISPMMAPAPMKTTIETPRSALHDDGVMARLRHLPPECLDLLFSTYFNSCQSTIRLFDYQNRIACLMQQSTHESSALKHAICAHAVQTCPQFSAWASSNLKAVAPGYDYKDSFYQLAREALGNCNIEGEISCPSLQTLQAVVLVGLYELQHAKFARAWMSTSRGYWLTQTMQLRYLDSDQAMYMDAAYQEETRKALWAANSLSCFLMQGGRMVDYVNVEEITTSLPQSHTHEVWSVRGITIGDVFRNAALRPLSVDEALLAARMLGFRVMKHIKSTEQTTSYTDQQPYNFWTNQHRLEQTLRYVLNFIAIDSTPDATANALLHLQGKALAIVLHEARLKKLRAGGCHPSQNGSDQELRASENALLQSALELAEEIRASILPTDAATSLTMCWIIYVTLQSLLRHQGKPPAATQLGQVGVPWSCATGVGDGEGSKHLQMGSDTFKLGDAATLAGALVLDSFSALRSTLAEWSEKSPSAAFILDKIDLESGGIDVAMGKQVVGLVDFTGRSC